MGTRRENSPNYESGIDVAMEFAGFRYRFNARDFEQRVEDAAARLGFVERHRLSASERADLVALAASGEIESAQSPIGAHVAHHLDRLLGWDDDLVFWLRTLVFRGAWLDQQVKEGVLEPVFSDEGGFSYRSADDPQVVMGYPEAPDWSRVAYRAGTT
jgi:hypothetical protein